MQKLLIGALLVLSSVASAQNSLSCLQQASNKELVNELSSRLGTGSGGSASNTMILTACTSGQLVLRTYNSGTGKKVERMFYFGAECQNFQNSLSGVSNVGLSRVVLVSVCSSGQMTKIAVSTDGSMKDVSMDYIGANCLQLAAENNRALRP